MTITRLFGDLSCGEALPLEGRPKDGDAPGFGTTSADGGKLIPFNEEALGK